MNAVTRWKTIATIAVAFSAGNLFATACQNAGSGKANAEDGTTEDGTTEDGTTEDGTTGGRDDSTPPPEVSAAEFAELAEALVATEADVVKIKCVLRYLEDANQNGETTGSSVEEEEVLEANTACRL